MEPLKLLVDPLRPALAEGQDTLPFLLRIQAPLPPPEQARPPFNLALAIDRSGSMSGEPLREAILAAQAIVRRLTPADRVAIVTYDHDARVLVPCRAVEDPEGICRDLSGIRSGGSTDLHAGWARAVGELRRAAAPGAVSQVLLLSDGQANQGIQDPVELAQACAQARAAGIGTSTYGLGDGFEEALMSAMAEHGQGRAYYGERAEDLLPLFLQEFELMADLYAQEVCLRVKAEPGVDARLLNPYEAFGVDGWLLPSIPYAGEAWAVVQVTATPEALARRDGEGRLPLFRIGLEWTNREGLPEARIPLPVAIPVVAAEEAAALKDDTLVALRVRDLEVASLQERIHAAAHACDWAEVTRLLDLLRAKAGDDPTLQDLLGPLEDLANHQDLHFAKEVFHQSTHMAKGLRLSAMFAADASLDGKDYFRGTSRTSRTRKPPQGPGPSPSPGRRPRKGSSGRPGGGGAGQP